MPIDSTRQNKASPTLVSEITRELRGEILSGAFKPGSALREVPLADRFGASRQSVREALRALADTGMVQLQSRRGAVVPKLSPSRIREVYTLRGLIEPFALRTAMIEGRINAAERDAIGAAFHRMADVADSSDRYLLIEADMAFHWALCSPSDHRVLLEFLERLQIVTRQSMMHMTVYGSEAECDVESHAPILHAVNARDAEGAAEMLREHIILNGERLLVMMLEQYDKQAE